MITQFDRFSNVRPEIIKILREKCPSLFGKNIEKPVIEALCYLVSNRNYKNISFFKAEDIQKITNIYGCSTKDVFNFLKRYCTGLLTFQSEYIQHKLCRQWLLKFILFSDIIKKLVKLDRISLVDLMISDPQKAKEILNKPIKLDKTEKYNEQTNTYQFNFGALLPHKDKKDAFDAIIWLFIYGKPTLDPDIWQIPINSYQRDPGLRRYQQNGGFQNRSGWIKELLLTGQDFINLDIVACHPTLFKLDLIRNNLWSEEIEAKLFSSEFSGNPKTRKKVINASLNRIGSKLVNKEGKLTTLAEMISEETLENQQILQDLSNYIVKTVKVLCKFVKIDSKYYWKHLHQQEQDIIIPIVDLFQSNGYQSINMHDGLVVLGCKELSEIINQQIQDITTLAGIEIIEKQL